MSVFQSVSVYASVCVRALPGRLLTYPPSSSRCPSRGSHSGGMKPDRDMEPRTYRHREPVAPPAHSARTQGERGRSEQRAGPVTPLGTSHLTSGK